MTNAPLAPVSLFRLFSRMGGWIVIILGVFLLFFTIISQLSLQEAKRFETEGLEAQATVLEKYTTTSRDSDGDERISYWLRFSFVTQVKEEIEQRETVNTALHRSVEVGDTFDLLYLRSDPERVETSPGSNRTMSRFTQGAALVFGVVWLIGIWIVARWAVAGTRARKYGQRHTVKVASVDRTGVRINNRPRYRVAWIGPEGTRGRSLLQRSSAVAGMKAGDEIDIYQGIKTGWWVQDVGERPE